MTITDGLLWQATDQGRNWLLWARRAGITAAIGALGVLVATCGRERLFGLLIAGGAALVLVIGAVYLLWDRTRFVEVRLSEEPLRRSTSAWSPAGWCRSLPTMSSGSS
ncbi:hypothetical protein ACFQZ4_48405 [Catellatospora coxensis]